MSGDYKLGLDIEGLGLDKDDVVEVEGQPIIKFGAMMEYVLRWATSMGASWPSPSKVWFTENGFELKILRVKGGGWQKVRLRFRLEFIPENPELFVPDNSSTNSSPLDDLRSDLNIK